MAAAEIVLRDKGVDGFSMAAVATAANMPVGNIYRRFDGKELLTWVIGQDIVLADDVVSELFGLNRKAAERGRRFRSSVRGLPKQTGRASRTSCIDSSVKAAAMLRQLRSTPDMGVAA
ncbi:helix-turn-helix domain-containing protein [Rhizobium cauense]|uniref:helix-turn-helix domain-containing protein n=1 Tax=Rhizobium cauense TaxID=1166683 RepID=UPI003B82D141